MLSECFPPFNMFIIGVGNFFASTPPKYLYKLIPKEFAAAFAHAIDTPRIAFAPRFSLCSVPSNFISVSSILVCSYTFISNNAFSILLFTLLTAFFTPFPISLSWSLSRNSIASKLPVEAPEGTIETPVNPPSVVTST